MGLRLPLAGGRAGRVSRHNHFPGFGVVAKQNGICAAAAAPALFVIIIGRERDIGTHSAAAGIDESREGASCR